jgi:hypothetical protein
MAAGLRTARLAPRRRALADQILAVLRDAAPLPLSTTAISRRLGPVDRWYNTCGHPDICDNRDHWRNLGPRCLANSDFVRLLRGLERLGHIERHVLDRSLTANGAHFWHYRGDGPVDDHRA